MIAAKIFILAVTIAAIHLSLTNTYPTIQQNDTDENQGEALEKYELTKRQTQGLLIYDRIVVEKNEDGHECAYFNNAKSEKQLLICNPTCGIKVTLEYLGLRYGLSFGCASDEEKYMGLCYKKCSLLANADYPLRTATNTCAKNSCSPNEDINAGLCYPKCRAHYNGVGPVCWGRCDHFCPGHADHGVHCYRWWPPHSCTKPSYGRGVGILPNAPWTNGFGCNGFGVGNDGECARIDISEKISSLSCNLL